MRECSLNNLNTRYVMRNETVEEYLKRGGKVTKLKGTVNGFGGDYKSYDAKETVNKRTVNTFTVMVPELRDWAARVGIIV